MKGVERVDQGLGIEGVTLGPVIGGGSFSTVYRAEAGDRQVVVKIQHERAADSASVDDSFRREAALLASLDHPALPDIYEVGSVDGRMFVLMEYFKGRTLADLLEEGPLSEERAVEVGLALVDALIHIHRRGVFHRDVKPVNVVVEEGAPLRLVDFGLATRRSGEEADGQTVGTPTYAAPEQLGILERPVDGRADLYSVGILLFECLAGVPPFQADETHTLIRQHASTDPPRLRDRSPDVSATVDAIVDRLLAKDPDDRYQTAAGLFADLEAYEQLDARLDGGAMPAVGRHDGVDLQGNWGPLVGRRAELESLESDWASLAEQGGRLVIVEGPVGSGKSHLVASFVEELGPEAFVLTGESSTDPPVPMAPFQQIVRAQAQRVRRLPSGAQRRILQIVSEAADGLVGVLAESFPRLATLVDREASAAEAADGHVPEAMSELLIRLARAAGPMVLWLEDIDRLDDASRRVLRRLCERLEEAPILLIGTARDDLANGPSVDGFLRAVRPDSLRRMSLGSLPLRMIDRLVALHLGGDAFPEALTDRIVRLSDGNPLLVVESLHAMLETGHLTPDWGSWEFDPVGLEHVELSGGVDAVVDRRIGQLDEPTRRVLATASLIGVRFGLGLLEQVTEASSERVERAVDRALCGQVIGHDDGGGYVFLHDRFRGVLRAGLPEEESRRIHQRIARAVDLADPGETDDGSWCYQLARHYAAGMVDQTPERAFQTNLEAGRQALGESAYREAYDFLVRAGEIGAPTGGDSGEGPAVALHAALGEAAAHTGRLEEAIAEYEAAIDRVDEPLREAELRSSLAQVHIWNSFHKAEATVQIEQAFTTLGRPLPSSRVGLLVSALWGGMVGAAVWATGWGYGGLRGSATRRTTLLVDLHRQAAQVAYWGLEPGRMVLLTLRVFYAAVRLGPSAALVKLYAGYAIALAAVGRPGMSIYFGDRGVEIGRGLEDRRVRALAESNRVIALHLRGEVEEAAEQAARCLTDRANWFDTGELTQLCGDLSWNLQMRGRPERAMHWVDRAMREIEEVGAQQGVVYLPTRKAACLATLGRMSEAESQLAAARDIAAEAEGDRYRQASYLAHLILLHREKEEFDRACEAIERYEQLGLEAGRLPFHTRNIFVFQGYVFAEQLARLQEGRKGAAADWLDRLARVVETLERVNADHPTLRAHQLVLQAVGCDGRGEEERAEEALEAAGRLARRHDNPWVLFEVARHRARRLAGRGAEALAVTQAEIATGIAGRQGWAPRRRRVEREFQLTDEESPVRRRTGGSNHSRGASGEDLQTLQLQRHLDAMLRVSLAATEAADPDEQIEFVLDELIAILNAERGAVFLRDDEGSLKLAAARDAGRSDLVDPVLSRQAVDRVDETGEPLVMAATAAGDAEGLMAAESVLAEDIRSIGAVPLVDEEESAGVVYLDSRLASGIFSDQDIDILAALAGQIPVILQRLRAARLETQVESERQQRRLADRLRQMTTEMHATRHLPDICRLLVDGLAEFLPVAGARAFVCREEQTREVVIPEAADASGDGTRFPERKSIEELGDCDLESLFNGLGLGAFDFEGTDSETVISPHGWHMAIPLQTSDALAGILLVEATAGEAFEESARRIAMAFGGQAGVALEHARLVTTDELTGLHNRRNFFELARREFRKMRRYEFSLTALMFDIDEFKAVNDTHGHAAGDEVLRAVATRCRRCVRSVDILGRYGGEEFALLLPHTEAAEATETVAERIRTAIEAETVVVDGTEISVTVSVGVAGADPADETLDDLLERADAALYRAKDEGRNRVVVQAGR